MIGFELIVALLFILLLAMPVAAFAIFRRLSASDRAQSKTEELHALENSLSLMVKELQTSVEKALGDMEEAADRLNQVIVAADDRIRQFEYYYEYGDELKPLVNADDGKAEPVSKPTMPSPSQHHALKHKEVHELSRKGWTAAQIARHTGMSSDEVQLIINLMEISTLGSHGSSQYARHTIV